MHEEIGEPIVGSENLVAHFVNLYSENIAELAGIREALLSIAQSQAELVELQRQLYAFQRDPLAQAAQNAELAKAASEHFNPELQGQQMAAVQIEAQKAMMHYARAHPVAVNLMPPARGRS